MRHLRALDGLRALAVLAVVATHMQLGFARGGGYGVDIFFVLSGFLITSLLLAETDESGTIRRRAFYARRALRLFPALAVVLVVSVILDASSKRGGGHMSTAVPAVVLYVSNWVVSANSHALGFLGQTWSLAIEEQFYLLWPLVLLVPSLRDNLSRWLPWVIIGSALGRAVAYALIDGRVMAWTPLRADGLLLGALVAAHVRKGTLPAWLKHPAVPWVAAAVVLPCLTRDLIPDAQFGVLLVGLASAATISHLAMREDSAAARALSWPPLVGVGRVSYGVYLYHYGILLWLFAAGYSRPVVWAVGLAVTATLTAASWFLVERPALRIKHRFEQVEVRSRWSSPTVRSGAE